MMDLDGDGQQGAFVLGGELAESNLVPTRRARECARAAKLVNDTQGKTVK